MRDTKQKLRRQPTSPPCAKSFLTSSNIAHGTGPHQLNTILQHAIALRSAGDQEHARAEVLNHGVPLWLAMASMVRNTMVQYQAAIATRNDQGQLASMQNKFVRLSLERLRLSIKEFLNDLPAEMDAAYPENANRARLFIPTRTSLLKPGESLRTFIVALGQNNGIKIQLLTRRQGTQSWQPSPAIRAGRSVYTGTLRPFADDDAIEYCATATGSQGHLSASPRAPLHVYTLNILA